MQTSKLLLSAAAGIIALTATLGFAAPRDEIADLARTKITLLDAVATAQKTVNGPALGAQLDAEQGRPVYLVEIVHSGKIVEVTVDARTGKVLSSRVDSADKMGERAP